MGHHFKRYIGLFLFSSCLLLLFSVFQLPQPAHASTGHHSGLALLDTSQDTVTWQRPRFPERRKERHALVKKLEQQGINLPQVLQAMQHVPRHLFIPKSQRHNAYRNTPLPIGHRQTISQPYIVAYMTQMLDIEPGEKVLEIGTGSGYQAAVLSELTPNVFTIEIVEPLAKQARNRFNKLGYNTIKTKTGDGYKGWPEFAPFHKIILTAAAPKVPDPLIEQLKPGGILVMPFGEPMGPQRLIKITKNKDGETERREVLPVRFVPMTGEVQKN